MLYTRNLIKKLHSYIIAGNSSPYSGSNLEREVKASLVDAGAFAVQKHGSQKRKDGEPYILHPIRVAAYAAHYISGVNDNLLYNICMLHDVYEDCDVRIEEIESLFGEFVTRHVIELTNVFTKKRYPDLSRKERKLGEIRRLAGCSSLTRQIKMLDRYDNITSFQLASNQHYLKESRALLEALRDSNEAIAKLLESKIDQYTR